MRPKESGVVENLLEYDERTAGRIMNPHVFALSEDMTVGEAITELQSNRDVEMVFYLYVVDERRHLVGVVSLRRLLLVSPETPLKRIMTADLISARVDMDQEEVARQVAAYNLLAIPVVDEENKLVGIITVDDVIDVIKDEATEDIYRLAGVAGDERAFTPARRVAAQAPAVARRQPGDRVPGGQRRRRCSTGTIDAASGPGGVHADRRRHGRQRRHADADGHRPRHRARRADLEQLAQGADEGSARRHRQRRRARRWWRRWWPGRRAATRCSGVVLGTAMIINMFVAATAGTLVPLGLRAANVDPALASSVFITTMTDVFGFFSFLGLATIFAAVSA